jgi:ribosomal protein S18 acetylase RimI-like enzyme
MAREEPASSVLLSGEKVVGFTYVLPHGEGNNHISCMCVHPGCQGIGLGKLMLRNAITRSLERGTRTMTLGTEREMRAYNLYKKTRLRAN